MPSLDKKTLELADALWVYEQSRMGEMLFIVPDAGHERARSGYRPAGCCAASSTIPTIPSG